MLQGSRDINSYMNKRMLGILIDYFLFIVLWISTFILLIQYNESGIFRVFGVLIYPILIFIIYCGIFVKLTNGSTLGGLITGVKIIGLDKKMNTLNYLSRFLYAFFLPVKLMFLSSFKVNSLGQLYYDEKFNTVVLDKKDFIDIKTIDDIKYYEYNYAFKYLKFFFKTFLFFVILTLLVALIKFLILQFTGS